MFLPFFFLLHSVVLASLRIACFYVSTISLSASIALLPHPRLNPLSTPSACALVELSLSSPCCFIRPVSVCPPFAPPWAASLLILPFCRFLCLQGGGNAMLERQIERIRTSRAMAHFTGPRQTKQVRGAVVNSDDDSVLGNTTITLRTPSEPREDAFHKTVIIGEGVA